MRLLLAFFCFTLIDALGVPFTQEMAVLECKTRYKVTRADIDMILKKQIPTSKDAKCMIACILKKMKIMTKDGKFDLRAVKKWLSTRFKNDSTKLSKATVLADECAKELAAMDTTNECDVAVQIMECARKKGKSVRSQHMSVKAA